MGRPTATAAVRGGSRLAAPGAPEACGGNCASDEAVLSSKDGASRSGGCSERGSKLAVPSGSGARRGSR
eukprot:4348203-Alexandrium_andersonii.AAC.1